ncbi:GIY-YIG nuclease family protein [Aliarcobacter butzleri]|uniref:GIY-YIG nuclease family protein n=1 Tax=Aliarcobacter butzleri TaxID=28197 RepID=UPI00263DC9FD|nr:GIY-YIG nuclease family protein [Aliarcobacter butzleri]MDN5044903.1 GIY-YIG nuclease family protein [Aliarcobacter butzleri]
MNDNGYIYVLMNPSIKDMVKIGKTTRIPEERAKEISSATGVPTPFVVAYDAYFESCTKAEKFVHTYLEHQGYRVSSNREFFEIPIPDAINAVLEAKSHFGEFNKPNSDENINTFENSNLSFEELENLANKYMTGIDDNYIEDEKKAVEYYEKAIKLGSLNSLHELGKYYANIGILRLDDNAKHDFTKAINYYEKYLEKKNSTSVYIDLANVYQFKNETKNALKIYNKMFKDKRNINLDTFSKMKFYFDINYMLYSDLSLDNILSKELEKNFSFNIDIIDKLYENMKSLFLACEDSLTESLEDDKVKSNEKFINAIKSSLESIDNLRDKYLPLLEGIINKK